ncbi:MAG: FMN-binding protein [Planctomycetaceae bacterium]
MSDSRYRMVCRGALIGSVLTIVALIPGRGDAAAQDTIEFLNGSRASGQVKQIRKDARELDFESTIGRRTFTRTYSFSRIHAVTLNGERHVLTPLAAAREDSLPVRSADEVRAIIDAAGATPPDWFEATKLEYPETLDLSWPLKPPTKTWESQKNVGQYIWSVINENPGRWHSGIKLVHHCLTLHRDDSVLLQRDMRTLGSMYFTLLQDYPRAAFWFEKASPSVARADGIHLAECYWRLGNQQMAMDMLRGQSLSMGAIKLYGDMGAIDEAVRLADRFQNYSNSYDAFLLAGDALRRAGRLDDAVTYYQKVIESDSFRNEEYETRLKGRARDSIDAIRLFDRADVTKVADGTYSGDSIGYNGRLEIEVKVAAGKIERLEVTAHQEKQYYASLTDTPSQIIRLQSIHGVDATSGATITSQAIVNATARALARGAK